MPGEDPAHGALVLGDDDVLVAEGLHGRLDRASWTVVRRALDDAGRLADALAATTSTAEARAVLGSAVLASAAGAAQPDPAVPALLRLAVDGARVGVMAETVGLTERQLHRRCLAAFGYGAKVLQRVLRFDRAMRLARGGGELADVAYRAGYADQAHLSREVRTLAGVSPTRLLAA